MAADHTLSDSSSEELNLFCFNERCFLLVKQVKLKMEVVFFIIKYMSRFMFL